MANYGTPSVKLFRNRKRFHESQKSINESVSDWFKRLQTSAKKCGYRHRSDYMLIDKFVSGLSDSDFEIISKVPIWTLEQLVLAVIGNPHVFKCKESKNSLQPEVKVLLQNGTVTDTLDEIHRQSCADEIQHLKVEVDAESIYDGLAQCSLDGASDDGLHETGTTTQLAEIKPEKCDTDVIPLPKSSASAPKKAPLTSVERKKRYIERMKLNGTYAAYQRAKTVESRERRINARRREQYLPSELQQHIIRERRRTTRERVRQFRERKKQEMAVGLPQHQIESNIVFVEPKIEPDAELGPELNPLNEVERKMQPKETLSPELNPLNEVEQKMTKETKRKRAKSKRTGSNKSFAPKKRFECHLCSLECSSMYELRRHLNFLHSLKKLLKCAFCSMKMRSRAALSRHLREVHGEYLPHKCPLCGEDFQQRLDRNAHVLKMHPDHRPFICEMCGKSYKLWSDLKYHIKGHTSQEVFKCEICEQTLASLRAYKTHMGIHADIRPHSCDICGKAFRNSVVLSRHLIGVHKQGQKPFQCETCAKRFMTKYHLKLHQNSHTGSRPFQCDTCESTFTQPSSLKLHIRKVHEKNAKINESN